MVDIAWMSFACRWFFMRIGLTVCLEIWRRQDALAEAMSICPYWSATKMPASSALLMVLVGP
eukprot:635640-Pelagomonas_calceolata.AAC.1